VDEIRTIDEARTWLQVFPPLPFYDLHAGSTALLVVDMQYLDAHRDYGMGRTAREHHLEDELEPLWWLPWSSVRQVFIHRTDDHGSHHTHCRRVEMMSLDSVSCQPIL